MTVYGCFAAGLISLSMIAGISWFAGRTARCESELDNPGQVALCRGMRMTVYFITASLATASSVISLIDMDYTSYQDAPVRYINRKIFDIRLS